MIPGPGGTADAADRTVLTGTLAAIIGASLFGMLGPLTRFAGDAGVAGVAFTAWRAVLGTAFLAILLLARGGAGRSVASLRALGWAGRMSLAAASLAGFVLNVSMFTAFGLVPIALALMLFYTYPAGVAVVDVVLGHERVTRTRLAALGLSSVGVVLVLAGGLGAATGESIHPVGILLGLLASASQVVFVTVSRNGYRSVPADAATAVILGSATIGSAVLAIVIGQGAALAVPLHDLAPWPIIVLAGVAAAGVSSLLFLTAIRRIGGTRTGILMLLEPVVGVGLAAILLGEAMAPIQAVGGALVLAGALVLQRPSGQDLAPGEGLAPGPVV